MPKAQSIREVRREGKPIITVNNKFMNLFRAAFKIEMAHQMQTKVHVDIRKAKSG